MTFKQDRLENEKNDPQEASSLKFINVPIVLLALFLGFGMTYLALRTKNGDMSPGDSRTSLQATPAKPAEAQVGADLSSLMEKGKQIFTTTCQACHQANGAGIPGAFPPLAESEWVNGSPKRVIAILLYGIQGAITVKGQAFQSVMPPFKDQYSTDELAAVATYIRNSFGNKASLVTPEMAAQVKESTKARTGSWNGEVELNSQAWD